MTAAAEMIRTYPVELGKVDRALLVRCIEECLSCAQACTACADACLSEADDQLPMLRKCIRSDADCADICGTTARILSRHTGYDANLTRAVLQTCAAVCRSCGDECGSHTSQHEHCRVCTESCRRCEQACQELIDALG
ncbi:MAG: four-helix bundle copper-binding protein [Pseudonocardiaceae bacterium]